MNDTDIRITINETTVFGILRPSAATASLLSQLPLDLSFRDYGSQEKIADLPRPLSLRGMPAGSAAEPYTGIIPIGTFTDLATIQQNTQFRARLAAV